jgi:hypothetical protein
MSTDGIVLLKQDHKVIKNLFRAFQDADSPKRQGELARRSSKSYRRICEARSHRGGLPVEGGSLIVDR